jgi:serine/threonine protein kinase
LTTATPPARIVGHYRLLERIGAGGMGVVYKAEDTRLGRVVALKFLPAELTNDAAAKRRFLIEARAAARLDHPNICTVYDVDESDEGDLYIAMAYYEGETLDARIARERLLPEEAAALVRELAQGLAAAHAAGIVHRDVKPANVILTRSGTAKILDFGLAKLTDASMTASRSTAGTAAYMAPEQIHGGEVTAATDVWGLGVVFYELLTGRRPFNGSSAEALFYAILNDSPRLVRELAPGAATELDAVVQKMLMKDPRQRYRSMAELLKELSPPDVETAIRADAGEHSRFTPGSIVGGRYRVVSLLGKGGMGAVYSADDLKLGQRVALKYIPRDLAGDAETYERICSEVRVGRQLSHPNICRIFDIAEAGGHRFIAMEYIDGEDLASLLRRIGRLPPDKAAAVMRDIAAGLAAAHDRGIVHRDLKPANVMIDGEGRARITDFGLAAAIGDPATSRELAGTPAYMAPEQIAGEEATPRSDIYALGLIAFETFRGRRLFDGTTFDEIREQHVSSRRLLSEVTRELDPAVERVIARCVAENPADRFATVHAVIAALPGGDPLEAAIAAGETPSPRMVAAAAAVGDLSLLKAWTLFALATLALVLCTWTGHRSRLTGIVPDIRSQDALEVRVKEVTAALGHPPGRFMRYVAYVPNAPYLADLSKRRGSDREALRKTPPAALHAIYRTSPVRLVPRNARGAIARHDPPETAPGMATIVFDHEGRLISYARVPDPAMPGHAPGWGEVFAQAGLDMARFEPAPPQWVPRYGFDARAAWTGSHASSDVPLRVEAATLGGRVVSFRVIEPWDRPETARAARLDFSDIVAILSFGAIGFLLVFARRNVSRRRADVRGAWRMGVFVAIASSAGTLAAAVPGVLPRDLWNLTMTAVGSSLFLACYVAVAHLAVEPYVRRRWPHILIGSTRLLAGRLRDPMIGRDLLIGVLAGAAMWVVRDSLWLLFDWSGWGSSPPSSVLGGESFATPAGIVSSVANSATTGVTWAMIWVSLLVLFRLALRRDLAAAVALAVALALPGLLIPEAASLIMSFAVVPLLVWLLYRFGILAIAATVTVRFILYGAPLTFDLSAWYATRSVVTLLLLFGLAAWGFHLALAGKPMFGTAIAEEERAATG